MIDLFGVFEELIHSNVYLRNWMIMYMVQNKYDLLSIDLCTGQRVTMFVSILVQAITYFTQALCDTFLKGKLFERPVCGGLSLQVLVMSS